MRKNLKGSADFPVQGHHLFTAGAMQVKTSSISSVAWKKLLGPHLPLCGASDVLWTPSTDQPSEGFLIPLTAWEGLGICTLQDL